MAEPVQSIRPVVKFGGRDEDSVAEALFSARVDEREGGLTTLELRLRNIRGDGGSGGFAFPTEDLIKLGAEVTLAMGEEGDSTRIFRGKVTALEETYGREAPPMLVVLAEDALQQSRMARRTAIHKDKSISDLVSAVASRIGLRANVTGFSGTLPTEVQLNESDLAFLRRVLAERDGELQVVEGELQALPTNQLQRGDPVEINAMAGVMALRVTADLAHQVTGVTVAGWDEDQGRRINVSSAPASLGPGDGRKGSDLLRDALGERKEHVGQIPVRTAEEGQALADTVHAARARSFVRLQATVPGDPRIRVGAHIRLRGTTARFENTYLAVQVSHTYDLVAGFETSFEARCAFLSEARP